MKSLAIVLCMRRFYGVNIDSESARIKLLIDLVHILYDYHFTTIMHCIFCFDSMSCICSCCCCCPM